MASSSSTALSLPASSLSRNWDHDLFPSFHGPDVRRSFLSHVVKEFESKAINLFIDNNIKRGEFIGSELERKIRGSKIAVVLLSKNYASSSWCLNELVEILKRESGQTVITIFYEVYPTDVRKQTGHFGEVFKNTCQGKGEEKIEIWRKALEEVATIAGYDSSNWDNEAAMIEKIAADISKMLNHLTPSHDFDHLIGMGDHMRRMKPLLRLDLDEVRMIGIWGPPGIGKTTIARFLFNQVSSEFQHSAIMVNIKRSYPKPCPDEYEAQKQLQSQMLSLMINETDMISHLGVAQGRLGDRRVLLVLDDVDQSAQLNALAKNSQWFGPKSRIIITTENRRLLEAHEVNHIYKVNYPSIDEALQMFCMYAFDQKYPKDGFDELSRKITILVGKLPLALKVMGSHFRRFSKEQWSMEVQRLRTNLNGDIESILKFSYDALCDEDKDLFLHIACFFNKEYMEKVEAYLAESFENVRQGLYVLAEKSLISIEYDGNIQMHNLLAQLGKEIVRKQSVCEPGQHRFLVDGSEIRDKLSNYTLVKGIDFKYKLKITKKAIKEMSSLQFLRVESYYGHLNTKFSPGPLTYLSPKLRLLHWPSFPMTYLPFSNNNLEFLVELNMPESKLKKLWDGIKLLQNLKWIDLSNSINLKKLPNLSMATNLKQLNLSRCSSLVKLPSSIGNATNLEELKLDGCSSLKELPSSIGNATNLQKLELDWCSNLVNLPASIGNLHRIRRLSLRECSKLKALPININMESLDSLDLTDCSLVTRFPEISTNIKYLDLVGTSIKEVPCSIRSWSHLNDMRMTYSENLKEFPFIHNIITELYSSDPTIQELGPWVRGMSLLDRLVLKRMQKLVSLPQLPDLLTSLHLIGCSSLVSLPQLPDSISFLDVENCESLEKLDCSFSNPDIHLTFINCFNLNQEARDLIIQRSIPYKSAVLTGKEVPECFTYRAYGSSVTVKLNQNPLPTSTIFKACILFDDKCKNSVPEGKPVDSSITSKKIIHCCNYYFDFGYSRKTDHIYIFEFEAKEMTSTEFIFEFVDDYIKIKECGVIQLYDV